MVKLPMYLTLTCFWLISPPHRSYDEGCVMVKMGREEPVASMDASGANLGVLLSVVCCHLQSRARQATSRTAAEAACAADQQADVCSPCPSGSTYLMRVGSCPSNCRQDHLGAAQRGADGEREEPGRRGGGAILLVAMRLVAGFVWRGDPLPHLENAKGLSDAEEVRWRS